MPLEDVADTEVSSAAFASNSVVQADRAQRRPDPNAQADSNFRTESRLREAFQIHVLVIPTPGVADVHKQDAFQAARQRLSQLDRSQEHVLAPKPVFSVSPERLSAPDEELLEERQRAQRRTGQEAQG